MQTEISSAPPRFVYGFNDGMLGLAAAAIVIVSAVLWSSYRISADKTDFSLTYVGARLVHQGRGSQLYDLDLQRRTRDALFAHPSPILYEHPPFEALLLSPLGALSFTTAYRIWGLMNAAIWLLLIIFLRPHLPWPRESLAYTCLWILFAPLVVALYQGQTSIILLALFAMAFTQLKNRRLLSAGIALGFGLIKLQFALPFALIFVIRRKWSFIGGFLASACILGVVSILAVGLNGIARYVRVLVKIAASPQDVSYGSAVDMPTLHGFIFAIFGTRIENAVLVIISAAISLALLGWVARRWQAATSGTASNLSFAAAVSASLVTSSHIFTHDFSPLILSMFLVAAHVREEARGLRIALVLPLTLFWSGPVYFLCVSWHCMYLMCPVIVLFLYAALRAAKSAARVEGSGVEYVTA